MAKVIVFVQGGTVIGYEADEPVTVIVRDYDTDGCEAESVRAMLHTDEDGETYLETEL